MKTWLRGKPGGLASFLLIAGLVVGGLGWVTAAALRMEREQREQRAEAERDNHLAVALWRLDSYAAPILAREDNRPFDHYGAVHLTPLGNGGTLLNLGNTSHGTALELSPLLTTLFDDWMPLHFQVDTRGWNSLQVDDKVRQQLEKAEFRAARAIVAEGRQSLLKELSKALPPQEILTAAREHTRPDDSRDSTLYLALRRQIANERNIDTQSQPVNPGFNGQGGQQSQNNYLGQKDIENRAQLQEKLSQLNKQNPSQRLPRPYAVNTLEGNNEKLFDPKLKWTEGTEEVVVTLTSLVPVWLTGTDGRERLFALRVVRMEKREICQGLVIDVDRLRAALAEKIADLFPEATLKPVRDGDEPQLDRTMTSLPFQLDPGPLVLPSEPGWTPLRVGLTLAWTAALVALLAVGLGGWSLLNLSERRIRFVSAVTHELRTPLTTLRLYLDMLLNGLVRDEKQRQEYLETLHAEADRLTRLVGNVLDFSRLENQRPRLILAHVEAPVLFEQIRDTWEARCRHAGKELVLENALGEGAAMDTDVDLLHQVLGNLIDNACKYSQGADDKHVWLRARHENGRVVFEVVDRGPGVPTNERRTIFRAFRRGHNADVTAGGVGLGLALARRWATLLGGKLILAPAEGGACFQVWLPA